VLYNLSVRIGVRLAGRERKAPGLQLPVLPTTSMDIKGYDSAKRATSKYRYEMERADLDFASFFLLIDSA
jgi:hypothetical protein